MNSFIDLKNGGVLQQLFEGSQGTQTQNFRSIEDLVRSVTGEDFAKGSPVKEEAAKATLEDKKKAVDEIISQLEERIQKERESTLEENVPIETVEEAPAPIEASSLYKIYRDRDENFECKISIQGAGLSAAQVRLIFDSSQWNFTFYGKLYKDGNCIVPIKRGIPLAEGSRGRARLEVIVDDQVFSPWEEEFLVEGSKKVQVEVKGQKRVQVSISNSTSNIE
jgi:hypothetical protein